MKWQRFLVALVVLTLLVSAVPAQTFARDDIVFKPPVIKPTPPIVVTPPVEGFEPIPPRITLPVEEVIPYPFPLGKQLDEDELAEVHGAFLQSMGVGALGGILGYGAGQLWDGLVHGEWDWDWADAGQAALMGAIGGLVGGFFP